MSIASRIEAIEEHLEDDYLVLELAGADLTNVDKNIINLKETWKERLLYFMANGTNVVWNNWLPKVTGTGENITLNNTIETKMNIVYKGNTSQKTTTGKNLFNASYYKDQTVYNETVAIETGNVSCVKLNLKPNTTYTISEALNNWTLSGAFLFAVINTNNQVIRYLQTRLQDYQTNPTTFTTNSEGYVYIGHRYGFSSSDRMIPFLNTVNIQIEEGNTATSFEEYTGGPSPNPDYPQEVEVVTGNNSIRIANNDNTQSQIYPINLGSLELCKIDNYQDYLYKENGKWYKYNAIDKLVLNGSENWGLQSINSYGIANFQKSQSIDTIAGQSNLSFCDKFSPQTTLISVTEDIGYFLNTAKVLFIRFDSSIVNTAALFKTWLSQHNVTLYYVLATPINEEITDSTLIYQLEAIKKSYNNQTNISQENSKEAFILDVTALGN